MDAREERGLVIAATSRIEKNKLGCKVPSQSGNGSYIVNLYHIRGWSRLVRGLTEISSPLKNSL